MELAKITCITSIIKDKKEEPHKHTCSIEREFNSEKNYNHKCIGIREPSSTRAWESGIAIQGYGFQDAWKKRRGRASFIGVERILA